MVLKCVILYITSGLLLMRENEKTNIVIVYFLTDCYYFLNQIIDYSLASINIQLPTIKQLQSVQLSAFCCCTFAYIACVHATPVILGTSKSFS